MEHIIVSIMMDHSVQPSTWILIIKIMWNSVSFIQELAKNNNNIQTDIIVMDFGKTLDKVPHKRLLSKLNYYDIEYNTLKWIEDFFTSCMLTVIIDGVQSEKN